MPDTVASQRRLTHQPIMSSDELVTLMEENVQEYAIIVTDPERRIISWSKGAERLFGYSVEDVLGRDAAIIFTAEDRHLGVPYKEFYTAMAYGRAADERYHLRKDGSRFWGSGVLTALREETGQVRGLVKILHDLTERKQLDERLHQEIQAAEQERERAEAGAREIERLNGLLRRIVVETHHRIKNSLFILLSLLDVPVRDNTEDGSLYRQRISRYVLSMSAFHEILTNDMKTTVSFDDVNARTLLESLVILIEESLTDRVIHTELEDISLPVKQGFALAPLFSEILTNAIKHGQGDIYVTLTAPNPPTCPTACLMVKDGGAGFPADFAARGRRNTGLELIEMLVQHDMGGEIHYSNGANGGAEVTITFPVPATDGQSAS